MQISSLIPKKDMLCVPPAKGLLHNMCNSPLLYAKFAAYGKFSDAVVRPCTFRRITPFSLQTTQDCYPPWRIWVILGHCKHRCIRQFHSQHPRWQNTHLTARVHQWPQNKSGQEQHNGQNSFHPSTIRQDAFPISFTSN